MEEHVDFKHLFYCAEKFLSTIGEKKAFQQNKLPNINLKKDECENIIEEYFDSVFQSGINTASGKFMGYVPGGGLPMAAVADFAAALTNPYSGLYYANPLAQKIENKCLQWFINKLSLNENAWGFFTSGGTIATLESFLAARNHRDKNYPERTKVLVPERAHHSLFSTLDVIGIKEEDILIIENGTKPLKWSHIEKNFILEEDRPWLICTTFGTTDTGTIDDVVDVWGRTQEYNTWIHLDAAYGGMFSITEEARVHLPIFDLVNSIVIDPHKGMFLPYGTGLVLSRSPEFFKTKKKTGLYMRDVENQGELSSSDLSIELTRHFRALRVYFCLKHYGEDFFAEKLSQHLTNARELKTRLKKRPWINVYKDSNLSTVVFKPKDSYQTEQLQQFINQNEFFVGTTVIDEEIYLRVCLLSFRTEDKHIKEFLKLIDSFGSKEIFTNSPDERSH